MSETYCGKSCSECLYKESMNCSGCRLGPGKRFGGECKIAECCRNNGHESCETCSFNQSCGKLINRYNEPEARKKAVEAEFQRKKSIAKRSIVLGKWLWILFWLLIVSVISSVFGNQSFMNSAPSIYMFGSVLNILCSIIYGIILIRLRSEEDRYRLAGIFKLVSGGIGILLAAVVNISLLNWLVILLSIPSVIVGFIGEYNEYKAHSIVLFNIDDILSYNWEKLWKWYIGLMCGMIGSLLLTTLIPIIGLIAIFAVSVGLIIVGITKLVYMYRTANVFRLYPKEILTEDEI